MCKIAGRVANSVDLCRHVLRRLIWVYTVCTGLFVRICRLSTIIWSNWTPKKSSKLRPFVRLHRLKHQLADPLRKHAYSNVLKILPPKNWKFSDKKLWYFSYFCSKQRLWYSLEPPRRGGSNEYPQSIFWAEIRNLCIPIKTPVLLYKSGV